jgi:hypothetical protein
MSRKIENYINLVKQDGFNTDKAATFGSTVAITGALTATGGVAGSVAATTLTSSGDTFIKYPKYDGAVETLDAQAATMTVAGIAGGTVAQNSKTGASTLTTPTGAQLGTAFGNVDGTTMDVVFLNYGNQTSTITAGDGAVSVKGTAAIATTKTAFMRFVNVGANTWNCYVIAAA